MIVEAPEVVYDNQQITFNCSAVNVSVVSYEWSRDGIALQGSSADLTVTVPLSWDDSCLSCHVQSTIGDLVNGSSTLQVFSKWG